MKKALITGIRGQDGDNMAKLFLDKGCKVHKDIKRAGAAS